MNTKEEILNRREEMIMRTLKQEFEFVYNHLCKLSREKLEIDSQIQCQDELNVLATDGVHTEHFEGHNSESSAGVDFDETKDILDRHQERLDIISEIYS